MIPGKRPREIIKKKKNNKRRQKYIMKEKNKQRIKTIQRTAIKA
jgi:hypothetical protein